MSLVERVAKPVTRSLRSFMYGASTALTSRFLRALSAAWVGHEQAVLDPIEVGFGVCGAVILGAESFVVR